MKRITRRDIAPLLQIAALALTLSLTFIGCNKEEAPAPQSAPPTSPTSGSVNPSPLSTPSGGGKKPSKPPTSSFGSSSPRPGGTHSGGTGGSFGPPHPVSKPPPPGDSILPDVEPSEKPTGGFLPRPKDEKDQDKK